MGQTWVVTQSPGRQRGSCLPAVPLAARRGLRREYCMRRLGVGLKQRLLLAPRLLALLNLRLL